MVQESLLAKCFLFRALEPVQLKKLAELATTANYGKGEIIFDAGATGESMFLIDTGSVVVEKENQEIARLGSGSHFGELALLDGQKRSASVHAAERTDVLIIPRGRFQALLESDTKLAAVVYRSFCKYLSARLRQTNEQTLFLRSFCKYLSARLRQTNEQTLFLREVAQR
jgi:CRP-like cAMP-binding protein